MKSGRGLSASALHPTPASALLATGSVNMQGKALPRRNQAEGGVDPEAFQVAIAARDADPTSSTSRMSSVSGCRENIPKYRGRSALWWAAQWGSHFTAWTKSGNFIASWRSLMPPGQNPIQFELGSEAANIADGIPPDPRRLHGGKRQRHRVVFIG